MNSLIIIPAYNEALAISNVLEDIKAHYPEAGVVVINDGSTDATSAVARAGGARVVDLPYNLGIGSAMQTGYRYAHRKGYDVAVQFDGDGQHRADQLKALVRPVEEGVADMVIGSRFLGDRGYQSKLSRFLGIKVLSLVVSLLTGRKITDPTSGFRAVNREVLEFFNDYYPDDYPEPEAIVLLHRAGFRTAEVPALMRERQSGSSSITAAKSVYYMLKVLLAILIDMLKRIPRR
ncbi:MAG TPA: glycosyltransferase family 2 protein [Thermodesulfovibrionales bacterium]|nr:glycosyltransferase family 2 protein [Thermodesulfovibrionales bacterium]